MLASLFAVPVYHSLMGANRSLIEYDFPTTSNSLGRITAPSIILYDKPSEDAKTLKTLKRDTVLPITQYVLGESKSSYNKIWYELDDQGFAHSSFIQPVQNNLNPAIASMPANGSLCEVTVPFTDGVLNPSWPNSVVYRLYYGATFWINRIVTGPGDTKWYRILDEEGYLFYVQANHLKVLEYADVSPISLEVPNDQKRLEVNLKEQTVVAYERNVPVFMTRAATGAIFYTGNFSTPQGSFTTHRKRPSRHMMDPAGSSYDLPGVPWVCYVNDNGVAFHGTYWHNDFGAPRSHGCINLSNDAAKWIYRWTSPIVPLKQNYLETIDGTRVDIW
jgi:hypothetical protein